MATDDELRTCPMCGEAFAMPPGRVPSILAFRSPGRPNRCQVTLDGQIKHRCPPTD